jgi:transposase
MRPDLKQAVLSLVVNGPSNMPIWMDALDGNSSGKKAFHETVRKVRAFQKELDIKGDFKWVADIGREGRRTWAWAGGGAPRCRGRV